VCTNRQLCETRNFNAGPAEVAFQGACECKYQITYMVASSSGLSRASNRLGRKFVTAAASVAPAGCQGDFNHRVVWPAPSSHTFADTTECTADALSEPSHVSDRYVTHDTPGLRLLPARYTGRGKIAE